MRTDLCDEALRLGRVLAGLAPDEPEVHGLVALMEIQSSRSRARVGPDGAPVLLLDQDRTRWDWLQVERGLGALARGEALAAGAAHAGVPEAGPISCKPDWRPAMPGPGSPRRPTGSASPSSTSACVLRTGSPVAELNRAVAVGMALGPAQGLAIADSLADHKALRNYHLLPSVRADLLRRLGRFEEARAEFDRAAGLTGNEQERALLLERAAECAPSPGADDSNRRLTATGRSRRRRSANRIAVWRRTDESAAPGGVPTPETARRAGCRRFNRPHAPPPNPLRPRTAAPSGGRVAGGRRRRRHDGGRGGAVPGDGHRGRQARDHRTTVARPAAARDTARDADHEAARNAARDAGRAAARDAARKAARDANRTAARKAARAATPSAAEGVPDLEPWRVNSDRPHAQNSKKTALFETCYRGGRTKLRRGGPDHPPPLAPGLHLRDDKPIAVAMHQNGPAANRIDLVFVGDGYTKDEQATFNASAERTWNALMTYEPYKTYQNFFDGWRVNLVSPVSGISNDPNQNTPRATPLGMHFWCHDVDRLLCVDTTAASA